MSNAKDKAFHANGSMTAAEYKRRFLNKKAVARGVAQITLRQTQAFMTGKDKPTAKDKQRLRNVCIRQEPNPGDFYKPGQERAAIAGTPMTALPKKRNSSHIVTSF